MSRIILLISFILVFSSCSQELNENFQFRSPETIGEFDVNWRANVTSEQKEIIRKIVSDMVLVEGGFFVMGATPEQTNFSRANEYPLSYVKLSDFYICKYEVSDEQYRKIVSNPNANASITHLFLYREDWELFIKTLNELSGLNFDFPTEAQWEFAARGGNKSKGFIYPGSDDLLEVWSDSDVEGSSKPNELGIYNMADLKSEWCKDYYKEYTDSDLLIDRYIYEGDDYVVRGGNYFCYGESNNYRKGSKNNQFGYYKGTGTVLWSRPYDYRYCRTTARSYTSNRSQYIGCRVVINISK